jgi:hypothetical protein
VAQLIVRDLSEDLVKALKQRAANAITAPSRSIAKSSNRYCGAQRGDTWRMFLRRFRTSVRTVISSASRATSGVDVYLLDTDVISEIRKGDKANPGVRAFFADTSRESVHLYLSVITIGELRQGVLNAGSNR